MTDLTTPEPSPLVRLENWSVRSRFSKSRPYDPPWTCLSGDVYEHPAHEDGATITTSPIDSVDGRLVRTRSREYILGAICPEYLGWCREHYGPDWQHDPNNPIKVIDACRT